MVLVEIGCEQDYLLPILFLATVALTFYGLTLKPWCHPYHRHIVCELISNIVRLHKPTTEGFFRRCPFLAFVLLYKKPLESLFYYRCSFSYMSPFAKQLYIYVCAIVVGQHCFSNYIVSTTYHHRRHRRSIQHYLQKLAHTQQK